MSFQASFCCCCERKKLDRYRTGYIFQGIFSPISCRRGQLSSAFKILSDRKRHQWGGCSALTPPFACGERCGVHEQPPLRSLRSLPKAKPNTVFKEYFRRYCIGNPRQPHFEKTAQRTFAIELSSAYGVSRKIQASSAGRLFGTHSALRLRRALRSTRTAAKKLTKAKPNTVFKEYFRRYCVGNPRQATACLAVSSLSRQKSFLKNCFALKTQSCVLSVLRLAFISFTLALLATAPQSVSPVLRFPSCRRNTDVFQGKKCLLYIS